MSDRISRRAAPPALALAAILAALAAAPTTLRAEAPMSTAPAPGFARLDVGAFEVTALSDGSVELPVDQLLAGTTPEAVAAALDAAFLDLPLATSDNAYLINTGEALVLVDAGAGALFGPTLGRLAASIEAAGYDPAQVDHVLLTHMHPDHVGGLLASGAEGGMAFPEAVVHVAQAEADEWPDQAKRDAAPEAMRGFFDGAMASLAPYREAGRFETFAAGEEAEVVPGITAVPLAGHTEGQSGYIVESEGESLLIWGDVVHVAAVQFADPAVTIAFDSHPEMAEGAREAILAQVAADRTLVAGAHLPFPGLGHVRARDEAAGGAFEWVPVNAATLR